MEEFDKENSGQVEITKMEEVDRKNSGQVEISRMEEVDKENPEQVEIARDNNIPEEITPSAEESTQILKYIEDGRHNDRISGCINAILCRYNDLKFPWVRKFKNEIYIRVLFSLLFSNSTIQVHDDATSDGEISAEVNSKEDKAVFSTEDELKFNEPGLTVKASLNVKGKKAVCDMEIGFIQVVLFRKLECLYKNHKLVGDFFTKWLDEVKYILDCVNCNDKPFYDYDSRSFRKISAGEVFTENIEISMGDSPDSSVVKIIDKMKIDEKVRNQLFLTCVVIRTSSNGVPKYHFLCSFLYYFHTTWNNQQLNGRHHTEKMGVCQVPQLLDFPHESFDHEIANRAEFQYFMNDKKKILYLWTNDSVDKVKRKRLRSKLESPQILILADF